MKKLLSIILAAVLAASTLASCAVPKTETASTASDFTADLAWLENRLGKVPDNVTVGLAADLGLDMSSFENDGYLIRTTDYETVIAGKTADGLDRAVRKYAKAYEKGEADTLDVTYHEGYRIKRLSIAGADISEFTVVRPADATPNVDFAISELVRLIEKATGVRLPVSETDVDGHKFTFAFSDDPALRYDGYSYEVKDGCVRFTGARSRGNMYAVWRFLQNQLNWRGLIYGDSVLQCADLVEIPEGTADSETPAFQYLDPYRNFYRPFTNDCLSPTAEQNDYGVMPVACHGLQDNRWVEANYDYDQICYTDEFQYEECFVNIEKHIEKRLASGEELGKQLRYIDIAQGDNSNFCGCKNCRAVYKEEGSNSGAVVRFANRLADEMGEKYPGIYYLIFAYSGTNVPPAVTVPNEWIYVTFCYDVNCSNHRVDGSNCTTGLSIAARENRTNATYAEWINGWSELTKNIYVWFYELDSHLFQYSFFDNLYFDLEYFHSIGVQGVFFQAPYHGMGVQYIAYMIMSELNWSMDMTEDDYWALLDYYLELEFGDGWQNVKDYLKIQNTSQDLCDCWHCWFYGEKLPNTMLIEPDYYGKHYEESLALIEDAAYFANTRLQEKQALEYSIHVMYEGIFCGYRDAYLNDDGDAVQYWCDTYAKMLDRMRQCGFDTHNIITVDGTRQDFADDLLTEVWVNWREEFGNAYWYSVLKNAEPPIEIDGE